MSKLKSLTEYEISSQLLNDKGTLIFTSSTIAQPGNSEAMDIEYRLVEGQLSRVSYLHPDTSISVEEQKKAAEMAAAVSEVTSAMSQVSDSLALMGIILSADSSGSTLKFSQVSKLISRLRYLDLNYGALYGNILDGLGNSFDKDTSSTLS